MLTQHDKISMEAAMTHVKVLPAGEQPHRDPPTCPPLAFTQERVSVVPASKEKAVCVGRRFLAGHRPHFHQPVC